MYGTLYLRDLKDEVRKDCEKEILRARPELVDWMKTEELDIIVGNIYNVKDYQLND